MDIPKHVYRMLVMGRDKDFSTDFSQVCRKMQVDKRVGNFVTH